jgi:hypothetical protein
MHIFHANIYIINNMQLYKMNKDIHNYNNANLHPPNTNLTKFRKGTYYMGIGLYNHLPTNIKALKNDLKLFGPALKEFLLSNSFYTLEEYFNHST